MIFFFHTEQNASNERHYKGLLFEELLRTFLDAEGYDVRLTRTKHNSLEYDLEGTNRLDGRLISGEAKAHSASIAGQVVSAFVGKLLPLKVLHPNLSGLFLSTSSLTAEAGDYLTALGDSFVTVRAHCGLDLADRIRRALRLPTADLAEAAVRAAIPRVLQQSIIHTNYGTFILCIGSAVGGALPDRFALLDNQAVVVRDTDFLDLVGERVSGLVDLAAMGAPPGDTPPAARDIPRGLLLATEWTDYRRPTGPDYFVGRDGIIDRVHDLIGPRQESGRIVEFKAKSGVGKSSLLAVLADQWANKAYTVELHDARDVRSVADLLSVVGRFTGAPNPIRGLDAVGSALDRLGTKARDSFSVLMVDQFESTFQLPEVYYAYEHVALAIARCGFPVAMVFARKDDLLTTHDDLRVSLDRLRGLAASVALLDFQRPEASALVKSASAAHGLALRASIHSQVLEFAEGFPWLLKRTMAHIVAKAQAGTTQQQLESEGLQLEDLFAEEVDELDEVERGYLYRLAPALPATYRALMQHFENDPALPGMLQALTRKRHLRLSASTYDVYNDVFKEYLVYDRLPARSHTYLIKLTPASVIKGFRALGGRSRFSTEDLRSALGKASVHSTYNLLREMRLVGIVAKSGNDWAVPDIVREYEVQNRLGEYVRQRVLLNSAVSGFLLRLEQKGVVDRAETSAYLKALFPFIEAQPDVWVSYGNIFLGWLVQLELATVDHLGAVRRATSDKHDVHKRLGNLNIQGRGARPADAPFLPSKGWNPTLSLFRSVSVTPTAIGALPHKDGTLARELAHWGVLSIEDGMVIALCDETDLKAKASATLHQPNYQHFIQLLIEGDSYDNALRQGLGVEYLSPSSRDQLGKKLANWARCLDLLPKRIPKK